MERNRGVGNFLWGLSAAIVLMVTLLGAPWAEAEIDSTPRNNFWGVAGLGPSQTTDFNAQVFAIEQIGNVMYVGGKFTDVQGGSTLYPRPYIAAFEASTGKWMEWWTPDINAPVFALRSSPDGSTLFVGGEFTAVNGVSVQAFAALDPVTGELQPGWTTRVTGGGPAIVREAKMGPDGLLYIVGGFNNVAKDGVVENFSNAARVHPVTGVIDPNWAPQVEGGGVWDVAFGSDRVYLGGFFTSVNNKGGTKGFAPVRTSDGGQVSGVENYTSNLSSRSKVYAVAAVNDLVFAAGEEHSVQVLNAGDLSRRYVHFTGQPASQGWALFGGGDYQDLEVVGDRVYASCHCWNQHLDADNGNLYPTTQPGPGTWRPVRSVIAYSTETGKQIPSFQPILNGSSGVWSIKGHSTDGCLWVGGQLTQAGGVAAWNLARLCDQAGPGPSAGPPVTPPPPDPPATCTAVLEGDAVRIDWTGVADADRYVIRRSRNGGAFFWLASVDAPQTVRVDDALVAGSSYAYTVEAFRGAGVSIPTGCGDPIVIESPALSAPTACSILEGPVDYTIGWDSVGAAERYVVRRSRDGGTNWWLASVANPATSLTRTLPPSGSVYTYTVEAISGAGGISRQTQCGTIDRTSVAPAAVAPVSCTATQTDLATYEVSWTPAGNDNAVRYVVRRSRDGEPFGWAGRVDPPGTVFMNNGVPAGSSYQYTVETQSGDGSVAATGCTTEPLSVPGPAAAPTSCSAQQTGPDSIAVTWIPSVDDNADLYIVRRNRNGGPFFWAGRVDAPGTSFTSMAGSGTYAFTVEARAPDGTVALTECAPLDGVTLP